MPRRSNDFQELVAMIQRALLPEGARVTESAIVDSANGVSREIDILIDSSVGPYKVRVAVEAKDESRKMDLVKFESIVGKYLVEGGVRVNKVVVVARNGFSQSVIERAELLDIELMTLRKAEAIDWSRITPPISCLSSRIALTDFSINGELVNASSDKGKTPRTIECTCGRRYGSLEQFARDVFWKRLLSQRRDELLKLDAEVKSTNAAKSMQIAVGSNGNHQLFLVSGNSRSAISHFQLQAVFSPSSTETRTFAPKVRMTLQPFVCKVEFEPPIAGVTEKVLLDSCRIRCSCCGIDRGTVREWAHDIVIRKFLDRNAVMQKALEKKCQEMESGTAHLRAQMLFPAIDLCAAK